MTFPISVQLAGIVVLGVGAQWLAWRLRVPSIFVLLLTGLLLGPGFGVVQPDALLGDLLLPVVSLSVAVILFEGGLNLRVSELQDAGRVVWNLVTIGCLVTWVIASVGAYFILDLDAGLAFLFGAVLVVTGPTVTLPLIRHIRPVGRIGAVVKWEGIVNDPIGAMLAVLVFGALRTEALDVTFMHFVGGLVGTVAAGVAVGLAATAVILFLFRPHWLPDYLHNHAALALVLTAYLAANAFRPEAGLFAVTVMGIALANQRMVSIRHLMEFKENLRVLLLATLFIALGARMSRADIASLDVVSSLVFLALLALVARPLAVLASTWRSTLDRREKVFLMWMAPRGVIAAAVSSVFALELEEMSFPGAERLVPLTFLVVIGTVALYGLTASPLARRLGLGQPNPQGILIAGAHAWAREIAKALRAEGVAVRLIDTNWGNISAARMEGLPVHYGSIISESAMDDIDLGGMGRLLALTSNNEANALAALHFTEAFGRAEVYQLAPSADTNQKSSDFSPKHLRGRILFAPGLTHDRLSARFNAGGAIRRTTLTREFDYEAFLNHYGDDAVPLFLVRETGSVLVINADKPVAPKVGQTLISLVSPAAVSRPEAVAHEGISATAET
ncbi:MAG: cation:proton antiporter [FCB group bacterium]|nr:cation:proton antiporter [FCB group bacterium]